MLRVVTFKWSQPNYRSEFKAEHVNTLARMVRRHYDAPHEFVCITDDPEGLDPEIRFVELWSDFSDMQSPHGQQYPSCYRRLKLFDPAIEEILGPRFVSLDLDTVVVDDLRPVWDRPEDFVIWGGTNPTTEYNGSMMLMNAGAREKVWRSFDPERSPQWAGRARRWGSDQGWISHCLGPGEAMFTKEDGVYSYRNDIAEKGGRLPAGARIVFFHGKKHNPWDAGPRSYGWVLENYK